MFEALSWSILHIYSGQIIEQYIHRSGHREGLMGGTTDYSSSAGEEKPSGHHTVYVL